MGLMAIFKGSEKRPTVEGWRVKQHSGKDLPHEVVWPNDVCSRCYAKEPCSFDTGHWLCSHCNSITVNERQPHVGLHERRSEAGQLLP